MHYKSLNASHLLGQFKGDEEILLDMIEAFKSSFQELLTPIRESIHNQNADQLRINAHTFKGVMSNFYAEESRKMASELEKRGQTSTFHDAFIILNKLEDQLVLFLYELHLLERDLSKGP